MRRSLDRRSKILKSQLHEMLSQKSNYAQLISLLKSQVLSIIPPLAVNQIRKDQTSRMATLPELHQNEHLELQHSSPVRKAANTIPVNPKFQREDSFIEINIHEPGTDISKMTPKSVTKAKTKLWLSQKSNLSSISSLRNTTLADSETDKQLLSNMNSIFDVTFNKAKNFRISRDSISELFTSRLGNDPFTRYFNLQQTETYSGVKEMVLSMRRASSKQRKMIAFLHYDLNQDGFICEQDLYNLSLRVDSDSQVMRDINQMVAFLSRNRIRSDQTKLPRDFLKYRNRQHFLFVEQETKSMIQQLGMQFKAEKRLERAKKFFIVSMVDNLQAKKETPKARSSYHKMFQLNYQVFCLIFNERTPRVIGAAASIFQSAEVKSKVQEAEGKRWGTIENEEEVGVNQIKKSTEYLRAARRLKRDLTFVSHTMVNDNPI